MSESSETRILLNRYTDAYTVAKVTVGVGSVIKTVGILLGILILIASFALGSFAAGSGRASESGGAFVVVLFIGAINGFIVGFIFYVIGIIVSAQGQILKASLDSAVNGSPFLTNERKAQIMSLGSSPSQAFSDEGVSSSERINGWKCICGSVNDKWRADCIKCGKLKNARA